jgi:hypothetical protein
MRTRRRNPCNLRGQCEQREGIHGQIKLDAIYLFEHTFFFVGSLLLSLSLSKRLVLPILKGRRSCSSRGVVASPKVMGLADSVPLEFRGEDSVVAVVIV